VIGLADELMRGMSMHNVEVTSQTVNVYHDLLHREEERGRSLWCKR
jgi:hypothetical protein